MFDTNSNARDRHVWLYRFIANITLFVSLLLAAGIFRGVGEWTGEAIIIIALVYHIHKVMDGGD